MTTAPVTAVSMANGLERDALIRQHFTWLPIPNDTVLSTLHTRDNSVSSAVKADFKGNEIKTMPHSQHSSYREIDEGLV